MTFSQTPPLATAASIDPAAALTPSSTSSYYERHIFFCLNERENGEDSCARHGAQAG